MECSHDSPLSRSTVWGFGCGKQRLCNKRWQRGQGARRCPPSERNRVDNFGGTTRRRRRWRRWHVRCIFAVDGSPLAVAGGGGSADYVDGDHGQAGYSGSVNPGQLGKGGNVCVSKASFDILFGVGGGGGLVSNGRCYTGSSCNKPCIENDGGKSFNAGGEGGYSKKKKSRCAGGFGGGGNCGGGGGYSGGGVQVNGKSLDFHAGGGGSFVPNANWTVVSGGCSSDDGFATFQIVALDR